MDRKPSYVLFNALAVGLFWAALAALQTLYEYAVLISYNALPAKFSLLILFQSTVIPVFVAGLLLGTFLLPLINNWLRKYSYGRALLQVLLTFSLLYFVTSLVGSFIYNIQHQNAGPFDEVVLAMVYEYLTGTENLKNYLFWLFIALLTILGLQVNDKYGPGNFRAFLLGKYFRPKKEDRIFLFLDLRSSTAIAEQLSEMDYFEFVRDCFRDATAGIIANRGAIYQYVGDEIVVSWRLREGMLHSQCIRAFLDIERSVQERAPYYRERYGVVPTFKAGFHCGTVVSGEIGVIKKDIAYSGDVLNTAARIQAKCNELDVDLLISATLAGHLRKQTPFLRLNSLGAVSLKGKADPMELFTMGEPEKKRDHSL